ncbi:fimbria/pilus periplasmic chaperone [Croceibacterium aestuarii]|uniref:fimbria/pilus periplasmic chaperone n=1 Tax=Croceibacterium aestuarii TaxID=3064139 RepID=UPI00272DE805|nr:fimbria/pilus periplasmic chaperone [Croceibacterium sp. D39]
MFRTVLLALGAWALALVSTAAEAARISPMIVDVKPLGRESVDRVELNNPGDSEFPVEVLMFKGAITDDGQLELTPADEDFLVFPAQIVVPPHSRQAFRVQYVGEPALAKSEIYYMQVRQVPVEVSPGESQVQVVVNFNVLVNVVPDGASAMPVVESIQPTVRDDVPGIEVRVANHGTRYFTAGTMPWQVHGTSVDGDQVNLELAPQDMARMIGAGVVAPDRTRLFFIPTGKSLVEGTVQASLGG